MKKRYLSILLFWFSFSIFLIGLSLVPWRPPNVSAANLLASKLFLWGLLFALWGFVLWIWFEGWEAAD